MAITNSWKPREQSEITSLYCEPSKGPPYEVHFDEQFTRRKRFHCITDRSGAVVFRSRSVADIIEWMDLYGTKGYQCTLAGKKWLVRWDEYPANEELPA